MWLVTVLVSTSVVVSGPSWRIAKKLLMIHNQENARQSPDPLPFFWGGVWERDYVTEAFSLYSDIARCLPPPLTLIMKRTLPDPVQVQGM